MNFARLLALLLVAIVPAACGEDFVPAAESVGDGGSDRDAAAEAGSCALLECDDHDECTVDGCDPATGKCTHENAADGTNCGANAACTSGACRCSGGFGDCDDTLPGCETNLATDPAHCGSCGTRCGDGQSCLSMDCGECTLDSDCPTDSRSCVGSARCSAGRCEYSIAADFCLIGGACFRDGEQNPQNECEVCMRTRVPDAWTADAGRICDDRDACTLNETCTADGTCAGGSARVCNDAEICTDDRCDRSLGCVFTPNTAGCDDGLWCNGPDECSGGKCAHTPPQCSAFCDEAIGACCGNIGQPCCDGSGVLDTSVMACCNRRVQGILVPCSCTPPC